MKNLKHLILVKYSITGIAAKSSWSKTMKIEDIDIDKLNIAYKFPTSLLFYYDNNAKLLKFSDKNDFLILLKAYANKNITKIKSNIEQLTKVILNLKNTVRSIDDIIEGYCKLNSMKVVPTAETLGKSLYTGLPQGAVRRKTRQGSMLINPPEFYDINNEKLTLDSLDKHATSLVYLYQFYIWLTNKDVETALNIEAVLKDSIRDMTDSRNDFTHILQNTDYRNIEVIENTTKTAKTGSYMVLDCGYKLNKFTWFNINQIKCLMDYFEYTTTCDYITKPNLDHQSIWHTKHLKSLLNFVFDIVDKIAQEFNIQYEGKTIFIYSEDLFDYHLKLGGDYSQNSCHVSSTEGLTEQEFQSKIQKLKLLDIIPIEVKGAYGYKCLIYRPKNSGKSDINFISKYIIEFLELDY